MKELEMKVEELEVNEEMMSDFEEGFWIGIGIVGGATTVVSAVVAIT